MNPDWLAEFPPRLSKGCCHANHVQDQTAIGKFRQVADHIVPFALPESVYASFTCRAEAFCNALVV